MGTELLEIQPRELKFTFELKKQSSCSVQLVNKSNEYIAFKVKTTSPKRYCVRPNTGVILPRSTCNFTVTMQAQKIAPPDMQFKDKFLVQSTIVPYGSADEDIDPSFFSKENGRYVEENKLRVVLVSPPHSPVLQPHSPVLQPRNGALKQEPTDEAPAARESPQLKDEPPFSGAENLPPSLPPHARDLSQLKDVEDLMLKISNLESKLNEAENAIMILKQEENLAIQEKDKLQQEIVVLRRRCSAKVQMGFPFLFVVFMALVGAVLGYLLHQ